MLRQSGWVWIAKARGLYQERLAVLAQLKRVNSKFQTALHHAAEQLTGLRPGDLVMIHQSYFESKGQVPACEHAGPFEVKQVVLVNPQEVAHKNPSMIVMLSITGSYGVALGGYEVRARLRDLSKYLTKVTKEK